MAQRGGKRPGAGRRKGSQNKVNAERRETVSEMARGYAHDAMVSLHEIALNGESEAARVSAANAILDRAYGKPKQAMDHTSSDGSMSPQSVQSVALEALKRKHDAG